jgi:hypothetical protein
MAVESAKDFATIFANPPVHDIVGATKLDVIFGVATIHNNRLACKAASISRQEFSPMIFPMCLEKRQCWKRPCWRRR